MNLIHSINNIPQKTGVYIFKDANNKIIYIGKAVNLRNRVKQYFNKNNDNRLQIPLIQKHTKSIDFLITANEHQALILEYELIKKYKPRYNVKLKDNTKYPYIKITDEQYPRILYVWRKEKGGIYYGPFTSMNFVRTVIDALIMMYNLRTCKKLPQKACIEYQMKKCAAPCINKISKEEYDKHVKDIKELLSLNTKKLLKRLYITMEHYSNMEEYEKAAQLRDAIKSINKHINKGIKTGLKGNKDIIALKRIKSQGVFCIVQMRNGIINNIITKRFNASPLLEDRVVLRDILSQHYCLLGNMDMNKIILPFDIEYIPIEKHIHVGVLKNSSIDNMLYEIAEENAAKELSQMLKMEYIPSSIISIKDIFKLNKIPRIIAGVDISHFSGKKTAGAIIVFKNGKPYKSLYRYYKLENIKNDDYKAMEIILKRFLTKYEIDILLVDGGKGQLNIAKGVVKNMKKSVYVFALSKRFDKLYDMNGNIVMISKQSAALKLIKYIRDEAHRFANKLRKKQERI